MRTFVIPVVMAALVVGVMCCQTRNVEPVLCDAPTVRLGEIGGFESAAVAPSEGELTVLPADTIIDKRTYRSPDGTTFLVSLVIGGRHKSSIHRPEMCLPSQGFQMMAPRDLVVAGTDWRTVTLARRDAMPQGFAYTFFNQDGFRTSSHLKRIFRDVWDRSVCGRIDRWAMVTVNASTADEARLAAFLENLKGVVQ